MERPSVKDIIEWLNEPLAEALSGQFGKVDISLLSEASHVVDGTTVLLLRDSKREPRGVVLCSAPVSPDMIRRAMERTRQAVAILDLATGSHLLEPLVEGRVRGLSYAVLPYCNKLSVSRHIGWMQRALLRRSVLEWLWDLTKCTVSNVDTMDLDRRFGAPLRCVATHQVISDRVRIAAMWAEKLLQSGAWVPRHVLMHGDLWAGNILIRRASSPVDLIGWRNRFVIIDWPGSEVQGYAIYDLVRLAQSLRLSARSLRIEISRHCRVLLCRPEEAMCHLLSALGHIAMNLEYFPVERYARMVDSCCATLEHALNCR